MKQLLQHLAFNPPPFFSSTTSKCLNVLQFCLKGPCHRTWWASRCLQDKGTPLTWDLLEKALCSAWLFVEECSFVSQRQTLFQWSHCEHTSRPLCLKIFSKVMSKKSTSTLHKALDLMINWVLFWGQERAQFNLRNLIHFLTTWPWVFSCSEAVADSDIDEEAPQLDTQTVARGIHSQMTPSVHSVKIAKWSKP